MLNSSWIWYDMVNVAEIDDGTMFDHDCSLASGDSDVNKVEIW